MGFADTMYRVVFRRTSTFTVAIIGGAFVFERSLDLLTNFIWENNNQGKLWKHIKHTYCTDE